VKKARAIFLINYYCRKCGNRRNGGRTSSGRADIIKVGIGPGSVCTTRVKTGVGYPQLSAIIECADAAHGLGGHIIADGGCKVPGDVAKAFGGGADFVMLGGMFAGHDESGGEMIEENGKKYRFLWNEF
jgi:GMP reductase